MYYNKQLTVQIFLHELLRVVYVYCHHGYASTHWYAQQHTVSAIKGPHTNGRIKYYHELLEDTGGLSCHPPHSPLYQSGKTNLSINWAQSMNS